MNEWAIPGLSPSARLLASPCSKKNSGLRKTAPANAARILETYHDAYRLLTQINFDNPPESFELADFIKAHLLKDKINNSALKAVPVISNEVREKLETLSLKYIEDQTGIDEIEKIEKSITIKLPEVKLNKPDLSALDTIPDLRVFDL